MNDPDMNAQTDIRLWSGEIPAEQLCAAINANGSHCAAKATVIANSASIGRSAYLCTQHGIECLEQQRDRADPIAAQIRKDRITRKAEQFAKRQPKESRPWPRK